MKRWTSEQWFTQRVRNLIGSEELEKDTVMSLARDITLAGELVTGGAYDWVSRHPAPIPDTYHPEDIWELHLTLVSVEPDPPCPHELGSRTSFQGVEYRLARCPRCLSGCIGVVLDPDATGPWRLECCSAVS